MSWYCSYDDSYKVHQVRSSWDTNREHIPVVLCMRWTAHDLNWVWCVTSYRTKASHSESLMGRRQPPLAALHVLWMDSHEFSIWFAMLCLVVQKDIKNENPPFKTLSQRNALSINQLLGLRTVNITRWGKSCVQEHHV